MRLETRLYFATMFIGWGIRIILKEKGIPGKLQVCKGQMDMCNHAIDLIDQRRARRAMLKL